MLCSHVLSRFLVRSVCISFPAALFLFSFPVFPAPAGNAAQDSAQKNKLTEIPFSTHDGYEMFGKLSLPTSDGRHPVVIYVQTAEGMTVDMKRRNGRGGTFNYFDLYREKLAEMNVGFFSYEGRGVRMGDQPPRFEKIEWDVYNTSTLDNKVRDVLSAVRIVQKQPGVDASQIFLMGASEGTLLAAEAASRAPKEIKGLILYGVLTSTMRETFKYIVSDGGFLAYLGFFDTDKDGKISKAEYEADPKKYREVVFKNAPFEAFDRDGDGFFTVEDMRVRSKLYLDAVDNENYEILNAWAKNSAGVATPKDWFKDHFAHAPIWTFLSQLDMPVGFFHGSLDTNTPIAGVRRLEEQARKAGKSKMEFHYFPDLDHSLGIGVYFVNGKLPEGHKAIFAFIKAQTQSAGGQSKESDDIAELTRLESVWNEAHVHGDAEALDRLWADDLVVSVPNMPMMTKQGSLGIWRSGRMKFQRYETSDIRVRVYDNSAVVTGRLQRARSANGKDYEDDWHFTKVYIRREGRWQVVAWHASESPRQ